MLGLNLQPKIVGREDELEILKTYVEKVMEGRGNAVLISGEAGVGKTRLLNELKQFARSKGLRVLSGNSLHESLTPYMPFTEALRSGGLESLFSEESPRIEGVYLVTHTGLLIKEVLRVETGLDPRLFAAMLSTVSEFVGDSLSMLTGKEKEGMLNTLGYENHRILVQRGASTNLVVILTGRENEFLINDMREILSDVHKRYGSVLADWDGDDKKVRGVDDLLRPLIASGKYDGIYYGLDDPKIRRTLLFENISLGLMRHANVAPTLLCIEDLQWADPSSLALLHHVARNTRMCGLLMLGTYRPEDVTPREGGPHPLVETMRQMSRENLCWRMELPRLPKKSMPELLSALLGEFDLSDEFIGLIYKETEGNPLFTIELVGLLAHEGVIKPHDGIWKLSRDIGKANIPSKIHDVILRRLDRLDKGERRVLEYASVIGEVFTSAVLAEALGLQRIVLLEQLRVLEKTHRLVRPHDGGYRFDHAKIKEVLYDDLPGELRAEYHGIIAEAIEKLSKDNVDEVAGDLAFHYYRCRNKEKATLYLMKVAENAKAKYSNSEATRFYNEALEFVVEGQKRVEILKSLGDVLDLTGEYEKGIETLREAVKLADDVRIKTEVQAKIGGFYRKQGKYDEAIDIFTKALEMVEGEKCIEEASCLNNLGIVHSLRGDFDKALESYEKVLTILEGIGNQRGIAATLNNIGLIHNYKGDFEKALEFHGKSLAIFDSINDLQGIANSLNNIGMTLHLRGDYDTALRYYERSLMMNDKIGNQLGMAHIFNNFGSVYHDKGDYDQALALYRRSLAISDRIGEKRESARNYCGIAETYLRMDNLTDALGFCEKAYDLSKEIGAKLDVGHSKRIFGMIHSERAEWDLAVDDFHESVRTFEDSGMKAELGKSHYEFGLMWKKKGEADKALESLNKALEIFQASKLERDAKKVNEALDSLGDVGE